MPPRARAPVATNAHANAHDDGSNPKIEDSTAYLKAKLAAQTQTTGARGRRGGGGVGGGGGGGHGNGSNLKEVVSSSSSKNGNGNGSGDVVDGVNGGTGGINWSAIPPSSLHSYRRAYRLPTPSTFSNPLAHVFLTSTFIGKASPTMAQPRAHRRVQKEQLALAVRKHFNSLAVKEDDVMVETLCRVRDQERSFRMKFGPVAGQAGVGKR
ncbi:hypothetical protein K402DRAFT_420324 [Aulographum hederae CBS 113979]|uniref:Histone deacetylase complex subunit SAP30 Sin3 binding domain-containing protein n=1 Tax=Aulographum hederae CBS 113979 TaxID=1176131 RepID=A0A6G1H2S2_9PEZI|nr:hypothetical protein K402DRAFT_420324 [Aulographum hederae CBS 113979]